jgi:indole-3-glycerol phosphate synthase
MAVLVEVHDLAELEAVLPAGVGLLGINNRNLRDFSVDLRTTFELLPRCPSGVPVVSESGILVPEDAARLGKAGVSAVLVGEAFMTAPDPGEAARALMSEAGS